MMLDAKHVLYVWHPFLGRHIGNVSHDGIILYYSGLIYAIYVYIYASKIYGSPVHCFRFNPNLSCSKEDIMFAP